MSKENVMNQENAEELFDQWAESMDIDTDATFMDEDEVKSFGKARAKISRAIMAGALTINDAGEAVYTPQHQNSRHKNPITFRERSGASIMATDGKKRGHDVAKMYAIMGDMTQTNAKTFAGMVGVDIKTCEAIFLLLMD